MFRTALFVLAVIVSGVLALDCTQIKDSQVFNGSTIFIPSGSGELQPLPANFNCVYKIKASANSTSGFFAYVGLKNGLRGVNDYILVNDQYGKQHTLNNRTGLGGAPDFFRLLPGAEMTIQIITKSVYMGSMFSIEVDYLSAQIGPTIQMKTGGEMNFIDVASLRNGQSQVNTVTYIGTEPIVLKPTHQLYSGDRFGCYVIDGTIENQTKIYSLFDVAMVTTVSNAITLVGTEDEFFGAVLNRKSEADQLHSLGTIPQKTLSADTRAGEVDAVQIINFERKGILLQNIHFPDGFCQAYVVSGPPNNSSTVLLDLSTDPEMPHAFPDLQYFSVVSWNCKFSFDVRSTSN